MKPLRVVSVDLDALVRGEGPAIDAFYRAHARRVLDWVHRLGGPWLSAEDVAHDVFAVAIKRLGSYDPRRPLEGWLYGITRNVVANARRRARFRRVVGLDEVREPATPLPSAEDHVHHRWRRHRLQLALEALSAEQREIIVLCDIEERGATEVAVILEVAVGTVYSRLHRARKALREVLLTRGEAGEWIPETARTAWGLP
jgi:RNA polymerase sigma-70 factor (ECF subfamily)